MSFCTWGGWAPRAKSCQWNAARIPKERHVLMERRISLCTLISKESQQYSLFSHFDWHPSTTSESPRDKTAPPSHLAVAAAFRPERSHPAQHVSASGVGSFMFMSTSNWLRSPSCCFPLCLPRRFGTTSQELTWASCSHVPDPCDICGHVWTCCILSANVSWLKTLNRRQSLSTIFSKSFERIDLFSGFSKSIFGKSSSVQKVPSLWVSVPVLQLRHPSSISKGFWLSAWKVGCLSSRSKGSKSSANALGISLASKSQCQRWTHDQPLASPFAKSI